MEWLFVYNVLFVLSWITHSDVGTSPEVTFKSLKYIKVHYVIHFNVDMNHKAFFLWKKTA